MADHQGKKRRVDAGSDALTFTPLLGLTDDDGDSAKPGLVVDEEAAVPQFSANELIELCFVDAGKGVQGGRQSDLIFSGPLFTHQLFANERFEFVEPRSDPLDLTTLVICRLNDLRCRVILPQGLSPRETVLLCEGLQRGVPADTEFIPHTVEIEDAVDAHADAGTPLTVRIGQVVETFITSRGESFEIWLASAKDAGCSKLVESFEKLAVMYIETADSVDFAGDDRWQCLWLAKRNRDSSFSLVGYFTLFTFRNPFAGARLRVCQALVLPPYQGQGLGRRLLMGTYGVALKSAEIVEVTVEDPAPGFQHMRDAVDFEWCVRLHAKITRAHAGLLNDATSATLKAKEVAAELKLTISQVQVVIEAIQMHALKVDLSSEKEGGDPMASFRLRVKRRLLAENPDLRTRPKGEMQTELEELYEEQLQRYTRLEKLVASLV